ncbi:glutaryl-CoA dehydrogenase [Saccharopolyspora shandongensis]|uniref:Glutaryl-CoA dehydrogenase n=1 Tax=Saccharopolyspora shandongensis TaxID=418495 RepID=A0A1H3N957_9PSEU|nr:acyl-CoA dehydrogenase family protein [Saccharopolyspora shandongensis]SDY85467.1 glutaryl-CoA dehydrogenase [Saccharopolyspora shandongensis]
MSGGKPRCLDALHLDKLTEAVLREQAQHFGGSPEEFAAQSDAAQIALVRALGELREPGHEEIASALPASTGPWLEPGLLPGDFYACEQLLSDEEGDKVERIREFARTEIAPIVDDYWARAEFPLKIIDGFRELGPLSWADPHSTERPPSNLLTGFTAMELAHADASIATFFGVHSGLAMGSVSKLGSEEQRLRWLPQMIRFEKIGAFALTEPHSGSDVSGGLETTARRDGDTWILNGSKRWRTR